MINYLFKAINLKQNEWRLLVFSTIFIAILFISYALLRPLRETLGISGGESVLKWLFLGTFIATLLGSFVAVWLSGSVKRKHYIDIIFYFFAINLIIFYLCTRLISQTSVAFDFLGYAFYIWLSVFNLFVISTAWSLLSDIYTRDGSNRLFAIISSGASIGSIIGASLASFLAKTLGIEGLILLSIIALILSIYLKNTIISSSLSLKNEQERLSFKAKFDKNIGSKNPFLGLILIIKSRFLLAFAGFILLLTAVSTFLYVEQARVIATHFSTKEERISAFASIDLIVQTASFLIQLFLTAKIIKRFGMKSLLSVLGIVVSLGFLLLAFSHPSFLVLIIVMSVRRIGEYALVKPGREMLFVPLSSDKKYKVKNFLDTVIYRGGDAISAQLEGVLARLGVAFVLVAGAIISAMWSLLGAYLSRSYERKKL